MKFEIKISKNKHSGKYKHTYDKRCVNTCKCILTLLILIGTVH